jgi:hypothetical protein
MRPNEQEKPMTSRDTHDILAYEEEQKVGINIQINTLIDAMIDAEPCLFHNQESNLMVNSLAPEDRSPVPEPLVVVPWRGSHPVLRPHKVS